MSNFYSSPVDEDTPESPELLHRGKIRRIANRQRIALVLFAIMIIATFVGGLVGLGFIQLDERFERVAAYTFLAILSLLGGALGWLLGRELYSAPTAALLAVLCAAPVISIFGVAWLSIAANRYLGAQGIRVGLMGADPGQIR